MADRPPVIAAWGAGVDSTAMIVELAERGEPIDMVLFADPGAEKSATYAFIPVFRAWMSERGIPSEIVRYQPRNFKHWPPYAGIAENMLTYATLPSVVFGGGACSQKWKAAPQDAWTAQWEPARRCWDAGGRVVKLIGYDASGRDTQRYHHAVGCEDPRYAYRYPLREWEWARADCEARILWTNKPWAHARERIITMHSVAVYLVQRLYGGPEEGGWYHDSGELCTDPVLATFGVTFAEGHEDRAGRCRWRFRRISIAIGTSAITRARSAASSPLVATRPTSTMAGPLSPFRPSVPATNDPNRVGLPFCQSSGVRSHEDLHRPLGEYPTHYRSEITVEAEDVVSACRSAINASHTTDGWKSLDTEHPTYTSAIAEGADVDPWRFVPDGGDASVLPVPGLFSEVAACAGYATTRSEDLVDQLHIMIDAIGAEGALRITPAAMVRLCATGQALLDDIATFGLSPTSTVAASVVTSAPDAT